MENTKDLPYLVCPKCHRADSVREGIAIRTWAELAGDQGRMITESIMLPKFQAAVCVRCRVFFWMESIDEKPGPVR